MAVRSVSSQKEELYIYIYTRSGNIRFVVVHHNVKNICITCSHVVFCVNKLLL